MGESHKDNGKLGFINDLSIWTGNISLIKDQPDLSGEFQRLVIGKRNIRIIQIFRDISGEIPVILITERVVARIEKLCAVFILKAGI